MDVDTLVQAIPVESRFAVRLVQAKWAGQTLNARLAIIRKARHELASSASAMVHAISSSLARTRAESQVAEILPLLAACAFLERHAKGILRARYLTKRRLPLWLAGVEGVVERVPFGTVLVIAPANYPLFLAGVQTLQALVAGNAVVWKPGHAGKAVATVFARALNRAGLPDGLLRITEESSEAGVAEMEAMPDKVFFTGSASVGRSILHMAAETATPVVVELSGCDAVVALPSADPATLVDALAFGMRLNGSATCMAPRRLILVAGGPKNLLPLLIERFAVVDGYPLSEPIRRQLTDLLQEALSKGALIKGNLEAFSLKPLLVINGTPDMSLAQVDIFAPVLTVIAVPNEDAAVEAESVCPLSLTVSIFGDTKTARALGARLTVGTVLINDLIVSTADPRMPFGGRRASGFGVTRGAEGLLEMTAAKTTIIRAGRSRRHYQPTGEHHEAIFDGMITMGHSAGLWSRFAGLYTMVGAARRLTSSQQMKLGKEVL